MIVSINLTQRKKNEIFKKNIFNFLLQFLIIIGFSIGCARIVLENWTTTEHNKVKLILIEAQLKSNRDDAVAF